MADTPDRLLGAQIDHVERASDGKLVVVFGHRGTDDDSGYLFPAIREALDLGLQVWRKTPTREKFVAAMDDVTMLERAFKQACTNLATISPSGRDTSLGEDADAWAEALLSGFGSPW
jgi:hypothetical protein